MNDFAKTLLLSIRALASQRAAEQLAKLRAKKAADKAAAELASAQARHAAAEDDNRRLNYNNPINFLADTVDEHYRFPPLTFVEWEAKKTAWKAAGDFDRMYASTGPNLYGRIGAPQRGTFVGQPYEVIEAEVRRLTVAT